MRPSIRQPHPAYRGALCQRAHVYLPYPTRAHHPGSQQPHPAYRGALCQRAHVYLPYPTRKHHLPTYNRASTMTRFRLYLLSMLLACTQLLVTAAPAPVAVGHDLLAAAPPGPVGQDPPIADVTASVKTPGTVSGDATVQQLEQLKRLNGGLTNHEKHSESPHSGVPVTEAVLPAAAPTAPHSTTAAPAEHTTKVYQGAGRLIQGGLGSNAPVTHTAVRRSFNAHLTKETNNNMDHYSSYWGVQYSPLDMAEYVHWTGDERAVTNAIEQFLQEGIMSKEEAIAFLQEIKYNLDYLRAHVPGQHDQRAAEDGQRDSLRMVMEQAANEYQRPMTTAGVGAGAGGALQGFPFGHSPDIIKSIANNNWQLSNTLTPYIDLPVSSDLRPLTSDFRPLNGDFRPLNSDFRPLTGEFRPLNSDFRPQPSKRNIDPMQLNNILDAGALEYERDSGVGAGVGVTEEEYEEMVDKLRTADTLYTQYTLEEIIYQLSKMMFSQTLAHDPVSAREATQRFMAYLEAEAARGQLNRNIEKKVLDIMVLALTDTATERPELMPSPSRDTYYGDNTPNRLVRQFMEPRSLGPAGGARPAMSLRILAAYEDELLKGSQHKRNYY